MAEKKPKHVGGIPHVGILIYLIILQFLESIPYVISKCFAAVISLVDSLNRSNGCSILN